MGESQAIVQSVPQNALNKIVNQELTQARLRSGRTQRAWEVQISFCNVSTSSRRRSTPYFMREVLAVRQIKKLLREFSIRNRFQVFVGVKIHGDDHVKPSTARSLDVENRNAILDL